MKSFKQMIASGEVKRADAMKVRLQDIHEEPGFNLRDPEGVDADGIPFAEGIAALADYMAGGGIVPPLEVRPREEGGVWLVDGHRRRRALLLLESQGRLPKVPTKDDPSKLECWVSVVAFDGNDAQRTARILSSQSQSRLNPVELAEGYTRLAAFGLSAADIGRMVGKTRQHVEQMLVLAHAPMQAQQLVKQGHVSAAVAIQQTRQLGDKAGEALAQQVAQAKAEGKSRVTKGVIEGKPLPAKVMRGVMERLDGFVIALPKEARERLAAIESAVQSGRLPAGQCVSVPAEALLALVNAHGDAQQVRAKQEAKAREQASKASQQELPA